MMTASRSLFRAASVTCLLAATALLQGCALGPKLVPAADAQTVPGSERAAVGQTSGVRITVEPDAWSGRPENLRDAMTPLKVTIQNDSGRPLRIRYNEFALNASTGVRYAALPPIEIEGSVTQVASRPVYTPRFAYSGFFPAPYYDPPFVGLAPWRHPWAYDRFYYDRYYPAWEIQLPTRDMREMAVPEGVLDRGGSISGFLYFPRLQSGPDRVVFVADLVGATDGQQFGEVKIPFRVE